MRAYVFPIFEVKQEPILELRIAQSKTKASGTLRPLV